VGVVVTVVVHCFKKYGVLKKTVPITDIMISMHMLYHITKEIYHFVANRIRYIPTKYH